MMNVIITILFLYFLVVIPGEAIYLLYLNHRDILIIIVLSISAALYSMGALYYYEILVSKESLISTFIAIFGIIYTILYNVKQEMIKDSEEKKTKIEKIIDYAKMEKEIKKENKQRYAIDIIKAPIPTILKSIRRLLLGKCLSVENFDIFKASKQGWLPKANEGFKDTIIRVYFNNGFSKQFKIKNDYSYIQIFKTDDENVYEDTNSNLNFKEFLICGLISISFGFWVIKYKIKNYYLFKCMF